MRHIVDTYKNWQPKYAAYAKWLKSDEYTKEERKLQAIMEMAGESLEVLQVATKARRKNTNIPRDKIIDELGDTLWGLVGVMNEFNISWGDLCEYNMKKLANRNSGDRSERNN